MCNSNWKLLQCTITVFMFAKIASFQTLLSLSAKNEVFNNHNWHKQFCRFGLVEIHFLKCLHVCDRIVLSITCNFRVTHIFELNALTGRLSYIYSLNHFSLFIWPISFVPLITLICAEWKINLETLTCAVTWWQKNCLTFEMVEIYFVVLGNLQHISNWYRHTDCN